MCDRLADYHWSPNHPSTYVLPAEGGGTKGIGLIAHRDYGAFNLAWADVEGKCSTVEEQTVIITKFSIYQKHTGHLINEVPLGDWLCFLKPNGFYKLVEHDVKGLPVEVKTWVLAVTRKAISMEISQ